MSKAVIGIGQTDAGKVMILDGFIAVQCDHSIPLTQECLDCILIDNLERFSRPFYDARMDYEK